MLPKEFGVINAVIAISGVYAVQWNLYYYLEMNAVYAERWRLFQ